MRRLGAALLLAFALVAAPAHASTQQESTFQDDDLLVFGSADTQAKTLDTLKSLGAALYLDPRDPLTTGAYLQVSRQAAQ